MIQGFQEQIKGQRRKKTASSELTKDNSLKHQTSQIAFFLNNCQEVTTGWK